MNEDLTFDRRQVVENRKESARYIGRVMPSEDKMFVEDERLKGHHVVGMSFARPD